MAVDPIQLALFFEYGDLLAPPDSPQPESFDSSGRSYSVCDHFERFFCKTHLDVMRHLVFVIPQFVSSSFNSHVIGMCARQILFNTEPPHEESVERAAKIHELIAKEFLQMSIPTSASISDDPDITKIIATIKEKNGESVESFLDLLFLSFEKGIVKSPAINWAIVHILRGIDIRYSPVPYLCNTPLPRPIWDDADQWSSRVCEIFFLCLSLPFDMDRNANFVPYIKAVERENEKHAPFLAKIKELVPKEGGPSGPTGKIDPEALKKLIAYHTEKPLIENYRQMIFELRELTAQVLVSITDLRYLFAAALPLKRDQVPAWQHAMDSVLGGAGTKKSRLKTLEALIATPAVDDLEIAASHKEFLERLKSQLIKRVKEETQSAAKRRRIDKVPLTPTSDKSTT